jgi:hypothetical protein
MEELELTQEIIWVLEELEELEQLVVMQAVKEQVVVVVEL